MIADLIADNPVWRDIFAPNGLPLKEGELIRRTSYSQTLAAIASHGPDAFYKVLNTFHIDFGEYLTNSFNFREP